MTYHWVEEGREKVFTEDENDHRELVVQIWYPAKENSSSTSAPYLQDAEGLSTRLAGLLYLPQFTFSHFKHITTNAIHSAPVADEESNYLTLIFLEGLTGYRQMNTFQVEDLVSHGYIVVAIDQPYVAAEVVIPNGRQIAGLSKNQMNVLIQQSVNPHSKALVMNG